MQNFIKTRGWSNNIHKGNTLFHSIGKQRIESVLRDDILYDVWEHKINEKIINGTCLTRNKNLALTLRHRSPVQFILDKDKLQNHNKIFPVQSEYQYIMNFREEPKKMLERLENNNNKFYCRSKFSQTTQWDEEYLIGRIPKLSSVLKAIVFHFPNPGESVLYLRDIEKMYKTTREYCKEYNIPLAVDKKFLEAIHERNLEWIAERLEEMEDEEIEDEEIEDEPLVIAKTSSLDISI